MRNAAWQGNGSQGRRRWSRGTKRISSSPRDWSEKWHRPKNPSAAKSRNSKEWHGRRRAHAKKSWQRVRPRCLPSHCRRQRRQWKWFQKPQ